MKYHLTCEATQSVKDYQTTGMPVWWVRNVGTAELVSIPFVRGFNKVDVEIDVEPGYYILGVGPSTAQGVRHRFLVSDDAPSVYEQLSDFECCVASELTFAIEDPASEEASVFAHEIVSAVRNRRGDDLARFRSAFAQLARRFARTRQDCDRTEPSHEIPTRDTVPGGIMADAETLAARDEAFPPLEPCPLLDECSRDEACCPACCLETKPCE